MNRRILLIDDNPVNLKLAASVLEGAGYMVQRAVDAEQAQQLLETSAFDLILMDIGLPGMDGLTLTRKLKADTRFSAIPIVALTASAMKGDDIKASEAGCEGYIAKPIDTRRFANQISQYLAEPAIPKEQQELTLLVVDDYPLNRKLLRVGLEGEGHTVIEAENGKEALLALERHPVDAVISDILMPLMDGFQLCHQIRNSQRTYAGLPFLLYTATYDSPTDRQLAETVGADAYLLKPSPLPVILSALRAARKKQVGVQARPEPREHNDSYVLEQYSAALVRKLEERNVQLQQKVAELLSAHDEIDQLNQSLDGRVQQRTRELDAANRQLEAFSYSVAHDLRSPLHSIVGFAELLKETESAPLSDQGRDYLTCILSAAKRMDQLIVDLLAFSCTANTEVDAKPIDLESVLEEALEEVRTSLQGRRIEWKRQKLPRAYGDPALLRQVLVNLLANALKYSRTRNPAIIEIGWRTGRANEVVVFVRDNGVGFDMQHANKLFSAFQRLHAISEFEGTGVGLATVNRIISRQGGKIWAEAAVDCGATFYFSLPAVLKPAMAAS